jgi:hypothetical protein
MGASPSSFAASQSRGDLRRALALSGASVDEETVGFQSERLTVERDAVVAEVTDVVSALAARVGVPV